MANRTDKEAASVHGTNPQNLIEYIVRQKIYDSLYWKKDCFGLSAERIVDKGVELRCMGGMFGEPQKPTDFICLLLKMLQIQPDKEIIIEFIKNDDFKYLRLLGALYLRLVGRAVDIHQYLEPLLSDYRRVRIRDPSGNFALSHIDELVDQMLRSDYIFSIALPRLPLRHTLEKGGQLERKISVLQDEFNAAVLKEKREEEAAAAAAAAEASAMAARQDDGGGVHRHREKWRLGRADDDRHRRRRSRSRSPNRSRDTRNRSDRRNRSRSMSIDGRYGDGHNGRAYSRRSRNHDRRRERPRSSSGDDSDGAKRRRRGRPKEVEEGGTGKDSLSVEATNELRAKLGLPPLK